MYHYSENVNENVPEQGAMTFHCTREGLGDNISKSAFSVNKGK